MLQRAGFRTESCKRERNLPSLKMYNLQAKTNSKHADLAALKLYSAGRLSYTSVRKNKIYFPQLCNVGPFTLIDMYTIFVVGLVSELTDSVSLFSSRTTALCPHFLILDVSTLSTVVNRLLI